jgi:hypothetical protein
MGFLGIESGQVLPEMCNIFNSTRSKNIEAYRQHTFAQMKQRSYEWQISINTSIYLEQEMIKDIVKLHFSPCK